MENADKISRVLGIYSKLINGYVINKTEEANYYKVAERSIQRDIEDIRLFLEQDMQNTGLSNTVVYDRMEKGYRLEQIQRMTLSNSEVLAVCKILLDSRAFTKKEMDAILNKLISCCVPQSNRKLVSDLIRNEAFHYVELQHRTVFVDKIWDIGQAIQQNLYLDIEYMRMKDKALVKRRIKPAAIMFSEYYFYLAGFIEDEQIRKDFEVLDDAFPTIYRIDRIAKLRVSQEHFHVPYKDRFEEGEFRKRIQFMYGGKLQKIKFKYSGESVEAVLDRLPTAKILDEQDGVYTISAEVFGKGIEMWIRSQGDKIHDVVWGK